MLTLMSLLMLVVGAGGFLFAFTMQRRIADITTHSIPALQDLVTAQGEMWNIMLARSDVGETDQIFGELEAAMNGYVEHSLNPDKTTHRRRMLARVLELQEDVESLSAEQQVFRLGELEQMLKETMRIETNILEQKRTDKEGLFRMLTWINGGLVLTGLLLALIPGWRLAVRVSRSLQEVQDAANEVAAGDLNPRLKENGKDEVSVLARSFNRMLETIRQADQEISKEVEERIRAEQDAQAAAKAKSDFLAHMSHEFRTPLNGILGYSQVLLLDKGLSEKNLDVVRSLKKSGESLLELINDVLDLSKIEARGLSIHQSRFYLKDFLESLEQSYSEQIRQKGLSFTLTIHPDLPEDVLADQIRLRQVMVNLIGNAIKFTDKGGIEIQAKPLSMGVRFKVIDTGIGIKEENLRTVFQPFMQVNEQKQTKNPGTGLGLSISHRLLEMMGSELRVDSQYGEGTSFWFDLPQPEADSKKIVVSPYKVSGYQGDRKRIFLVEPRTDVGTSLTPLLRKVGFHVHTFQSGEEVQGEMFSLHPDAILMDLYLGDEDGAKVMDAVYAAYEKRGERPPPVILFSDHRQPEDRDRSMSMGAVDFMTKPVRFTDLLKVLETQLELSWRNEGEGRSERSSGSDAGGGTEGEVAEVVPGEEILRELHTLAQVGNVRKLRSRIENLQEENREFVPFCESLLTMCASYRVNAVLQKLQTLLPIEPETTASP